MAGQQLLVAEGNCFYAGGGVFRAFFHRQELDECTNQSRRVRYVVEDDLTLEIIRQGFELLVSDALSCVIGSTTVHCTRNEGFSPTVSLKIGSDVYELKLSSRGTGAARLRVWLPATAQDSEIDPQEIEEMLGGGSEDEIPT